MSRLLLQSLGDPLFAVPFGAAVGTGLLAVLCAVVFRRWGRRRAEAPTERWAVRVGAGALAVGGGALVAFGFGYARHFAELRRAAAGAAGDDPTRLGRVGLAVPWNGVAAAAGVVCVAGFAAAVGLGIAAELRD